VVERREEAEEPMTWREGGRERGWAGGREGAREGRRKGGRADLAAGGFAGEPEVDKFDVTLHRDEDILRLPGGEKREKGREGGWAGGREEGGGQVWGEKARRVQKGRELTKGREGKGGGRREGGRAGKRTGSRHLDVPMDDPVLVQKLDCQDSLCQIVPGHGYKKWEGTGTGL
jgi:hypothetical protein